MWYFQVSNDLGNILYSQGSGVLSSSEKAFGLGKTMMHTLNVATKYCKTSQAIQIGEEFISAQKIFSFKNENLYFSCALEINENDFSNLDSENMTEIICEGILETIYYCFTMLYGYKKLYDYTENINKWHKSIKVFFIYFKYFFEKKKNEVFFLYKI